MFENNYDKVWGNTKKDDFNEFEIDMATMSTSESKAKWGLKMSMGAMMMGILMCYNI